jgi:ABC-type transport system involved in multi-copper enzyme maturation permease subunit
VFGAALAAVSAHLGTQDFVDRAAAHTELVQQRALDFNREDRQVTGWRPDPALRAIRAPQPLSIVVTGFDVTLTDFWDFGPAGRRTGRQYARHADLHGRIDLEFVIRIVLGLLGLILVLESIAGERANGMLLALLAQAIRPGVIIGAKIAAGAATLAVSVAVAIGAALTAILLVQPDVVTRDVLWSMAFIGVAGCLYLVTYFAVGALVSSATASYRIALAATTILWLFGGVVALPVTQLVASNLSPVPPLSLLEAESERIMRERIDEAEVAVGDEYLAAVPPGVHWSRASRDPAWASSAVARLEPIWERHNARLVQELESINARAASAAERQGRIVQGLTLVSPGAQFAASAMNLAGTGTALVQTWDSQTAAYQADLNRLVFHNRPRLTGIIHADSEGNGSRRWEVGVNRRPFPTLESLPAFRQPAPLTLGDRLRHASPQVAVLTLYALALSIAATWMFGRIRF